MKRLLSLAVIVVLALFAVAASGQTPATTSVTFKRWTVYTFDGKTHSVKLGGTYKYCPKASPVWKVRAQITYKDAVVGDSYTTTWKRGSQTLFTNPHQWTKTTGPLGLSLSRNSGVGTGRFGVQIAQAGQSLGKSSVGVAVRRKCKKR